LEKINIFRLSIVFVLVLITGCSDQKWAGKSIEETFADKKIIQLVHKLMDEDVPAINQLISEGVDVNTVGLNYITPLAWAAVKMKYKSVATLLKAGADPHIQLTNDHSVFSMIVGGDKTELLEVFIANSKALDALSPKGMPLIPVAVFNSRWTHLDLLLDAGADINNHNRFGRSAARTAAALSDYDKVVYLLERGYTYDLIGLAKSIQGSYGSKGDSCEWKKKVVKKLQSKGIVFPIFVSKKKRAFPGPCINVNDFN
jgi:ankyrin repeat protein